MLSIGEASKQVRVSTYTLRYWEKEFNGILVPRRTRGGQRRYTKKSLRILNDIYYLLRVELYSIKGAKKILEKKYGEKNSKLS